MKTDRIKYIGREVENLKGIKKERIDLPVFEISALKDYEPIFKFLNQKDKDILYLFFVNRKKQCAVQKILDRSQPSLCYDIQRIRERMEFIHYLNNVFDIFINFLNTKGNLYDSHSIEIIVAMFYTTSLTQTAAILKCPQLRVRYRFEKILKRMESLGHWEIFEIFMAIRNNLNIVKRIYKEESVLSS